MLVIALPFSSAVKTRVQILVERGVIRPRGPEGSVVVTLPVQPGTNHNELRTPGIKLVVVATGHKAPSSLGNGVCAVISLRLSIKAKVLRIPNKPVALFAVREHPEIYWSIEVRVAAWSVVPSGTGSRGRINRVRPLVAITAIGKLASGSFCICRNRRVARRNVLRRGC